MGRGRCGVAWRGRWRAAESVDIRDEDGRERALELQIGPQRNSGQSIITTRQKKTGRKVGVDSG